MNKRFEKISSYIRGRWFVVRGKIRKMQALEQEKLFQEKTKNYI